MSIAPLFKQPGLTADQIRNFAFSWRASRVLLTACELDVFTILGESWKQSTEVAESLEADPRATDRLMNALAGMGVLVKKDGSFANTEAALRFLVRGSDGYIHSLDHVANLWKSWSTLTDAVRQGSRVLESPGIKWDTQSLHAFIAGMHDRARDTADETILSLDLTDVSRVLDVGGGSGVYSMAMARAKEDLRATVFDLPHVVPITEQYIRKSGFSERIDTLAGDYNVDDFGNGYDMVFLSAVVLINSPEANRKLIGKCAGALKPGGQVVVQDYILDEDRTAPLHATLYALNMLVVTRAGDTYTEQEVRSWMEEAGLRRITRTDTRFGVSQITGWNAE
ncbi:MAG: methyltransferase domain-containing protein [Chlorobi bacterium]|nr:methyltransferase domain-containing protein [Chlorobiota bacterium]